MPADFRYAIGIQFALVAPLHAAEEFIASALQGNVEVGHEVLGVGYETNGFVFKEIGLDGTNPEALKAGHLVEGLNKVEEGMVMAFIAVLAFAVVANIHPGEDDLADALLGNFPGIGQDIVEAIAAGDTARLGNGAVGAFVVATVLYFEESAGAIAQGVGADVKVGLVNFAGVYLADLIFGEVVQVLVKLKFFGGAEDEVYPLDLRDLFGLELGVATDDGDVGLGVALQGFAHPVAALFVRVLGNGAGVDHVDIGPLLEIYLLKSALADVAGNARRF